MITWQLERDMGHRLMSLLGGGKWFVQILIVIKMSLLVVTFN